MSVRKVLYCFVYKVIYNAFQSSSAVARKENHAIGELGMSFAALSLIPCDNFCEAPVA